MPAISKNAPLITEYLAAHKPATITRIARALHLVRSSVAMALRDNPQQFCVVGYDETSHRAQVAQVWGLLPPNGKPPVVEPPTPLHLKAYDYLTEHGPSAASEIAAAVGVRDHALRQTFRVSSDLFFVVEIRTGAQGTGTRPVQIWDVEQPEPVQRDERIIEWTHTQPGGRSWVMRGIPYGSGVLIAGTVFEVPAEWRWVSE